MGLKFNPFTGRLDRVGSGIKKDGTSITTAPIPFAQGLSIGSEVRIDLPTTSRINFESDADGYTYIRSSDGSDVFPAGSLIFGADYNLGSTIDFYWVNGEDSGIQMSLRNGKLKIGDGAPHSHLHVVGSVATITRLITESGNVLDTDYSLYVDTSSGGIKLDLPTAVGIEGRIYVFSLINVSSNLEIVPNGSETINGVGGNRIMNVVDTSLTIQAFQGNWRIIAQV